MKINHRSPLLCMMCRYNACYEELPVCADCLADFQEIISARCINCSKPPSACECSNNSNIRFLFFYDGFCSKKLIHFVKSNTDAEALKFLAEMLVRCCGIKPNRYDGVAFVPRRKRAIRRYGYDQAKEIAKAISNLYSIPLVDAIKRVGRGEQKLLSSGARYKSIKNKYQLKEGFPKEVKYKRILLVDDIYTTGATIKACSELLRGSVSEAVVPLVLAKTNYENK